MTTLTATSLSRAPDSQLRTGRLHRLRSFWQQFTRTAFNPYRPELHYMRGPGPACRAKRAAASVSDLT
jgi:hypothetical protein